MWVLQNHPKQSYKVESLLRTIDLEGCNSERQCGVVARVLNEELGDSDLNSHVAGRPHLLGNIDLNPLGPITHL